MNDIPISLVSSLPQQCFASNDFESVESSSELIFASEVPHFTQVFAIPGAIESGTSVSLKCSATGLPLPQLMWTLDGQPIGDHSRLRVGDYVTSDGVVNSFVNISYVRTNDGGV